MQPIARIPYILYLPMEAEAAPRDAQIRQVILSWWGEHAEEALRGLAKEMLEANILIFSDPAPVMMDEGPAMALAFAAQSLGAGEEERRRIDDAHSWIMVWASETLTHPPIEHILAMGALRALTAAFKGVGVDGCTGAALPLARNAEPVSANMTRLLREELGFVGGEDEESRTLSPRTTGMGKLGLPDITVRNLPDAMQPAVVAPLVLGVAYTLAARAAELVEERGEKATHLKIGPDIEVTSADILAANGRDAGIKYRGGRTVRLALSYVPPKRKRSKKLPPGFAPFLFDEEKELYDGLIVIGPADGVPESSAEGHWFELAAQRLGIGEPAEGEDADADDIRSRRAGDDPVMVPFMPLVQMMQIVCFRGLPPGVKGRDQELAEIGMRWWDQYAPEGMIGGVKFQYEAGGLQFGKISAKPPDSNLLDLAMRTAGAEERKRLTEATHTVTVSAIDMLVMPQAARFGLWAIIAAARSLAQAFDGVVFDLNSWHTIPVSRYAQRLPNSGTIAMGQHILVNGVQCEDGRLWVKTRGMAKFGLPDIEIADLPPTLFDGFRPVMFGIAHRVATHAAEYVERLVKEPGAGEKLGQIEFPPAFDLKVEDIRDAIRPRGEEDPDMKPPEEDEELRFAAIGLSLRTESDSDATYLSVVPPAGCPHDLGAWCHEVLDSLHPSSPNYFHIPQVDTPAMCDAKKRARAELPAVRDQFLNGLPPGQMIFLKHSFPIPSSHGAAVTD